MEKTNTEPSEQVAAPKKTREKRIFDFERNSKTIFVGNLPTTFDQKKVAKLFKDCGKVESARIRSIVPEKEKLAPKVALITKRIHHKVDSFNAYVVFEDNENDECVKKALAKNGQLIDGHHIRVDRASRPKAKKETLTSRKKSVFLGNLRFDLREDDLINHFKSKGPVDYVRLVRDRDTGAGKGFGFVVFKDRASVKNALELDDTDFKGRKMRVKKIDDPKGKKPNKAKNDHERPKKIAKKDDEVSNMGDEMSNMGDDTDEEMPKMPAKTEHKKPTFRSKTYDEKPNMRVKKFDGHRGKKPNMRAKADGKKPNMRAKNQGKKPNMRAKNVGGKKPKKFNKTRAG